MTEQKRTEFAMKALGLAELFVIHLGAERLAGNGTSFRLEIAAPDGESTGGGKQAVQHIKLVPDTGATIVCGSANGVEEICELRTYDHLTQIHSQRFKGASLPFAREPYGALLKKLQAFFAMQKLPVTLVDVPRNPEGTPVTVNPPGSGTGPVMVAGAVAIVAIIAALAFFLLK